MDKDVLANNLETEAFDRDYNSREYCCPVCGKQFHIPMYMSKSEYVYTVLIYDKNGKKSKQRKCCSYSCYRKATK